jgi:phosphatidylglycerophosphatase A
MGTLGLLFRWSPAIFWCSFSALVLVLLARVTTYTDPRVVAGAAIAAASAIAMLVRRHQHHTKLSLRWLKAFAADVATVGAAGLTPKGSGTIGAVAALPAGWLLARVDWPIRAAVLAVLTIATTYATEVYVRSAAAALGSDAAHLDPSEVVVDEYVGVLLALAFVPWTWPWATAAFVLFRILDITKPGPVAWGERSFPGGLGVMLDDVIAGLLAGLALAIARAVM